MNRTSRSRLALFPSLFLIVLASICFQGVARAQSSDDGVIPVSNEFEDQATASSDSSSTSTTPNQTPTPEPSTQETNTATPQATPPPICGEDMNCQPAPTPTPPCVDCVDDPLPTPTPPPPPPLPPAPVCLETVTANVVALDQVYTYNRFGAFNPAGMIYALRRDVVGSGPGNVRLRAGKRPRPIVLRVNEGDCLQVNFTNLLSPSRPNNDSTLTRTASVHVNGLDYVDGVQSDGANVGRNASSLAAPGQTLSYKWYAAKQGQYLMYSMGAPAGAEGDNGQAGLGLFGSVNVEPKGAKWYRSQVTAAELAAVTLPERNRNGTPKINYEAVNAAGEPILNMLSPGGEIIHTDLNALITDFVEDCTDAPPTSICGEPFREFTVLFHDEIKAVQAFPELEEELFHGVRDGFAVNYGASGLGSILLANRKGIGPSKNCKECKFEDFFLESSVNGDPALLVRKDASGKAVEALYPDDPSNVHHSYLGDPVRYRNMHVGKETHVFHLHAHQWLQSPRDDSSTYLDSQTISPGGSFTYEINYGGSGNRNLTPGDSIFHCHLYPHFAQGMWELWRVHDVFESGTASRNLPDAEIAGGVPTPAIVPLKDRAMPPMPSNEFPGYPFYIGRNYNQPFVVGHRPPQPPLDIEWDGGLPRHRILSAQVVDGEAAIEPHLLLDPVAQRVLNTYDANDPDPTAPAFPSITARRSTLLQFARKLTSAKLEFLPHGGTALEQAAMRFHEGTIAQMTVHVPSLDEPCRFCEKLPNPCGETANCEVGATPTSSASGEPNIPPSCDFIPCLPPDDGFSQSVSSVPVVTKYGWPARGYPSYTPQGTPGLFLVNGQPPVAGAPFADPCAPGTPVRNYRAAYIQFDMPVNRSGWHDRQARVTTLEDDAIATRDGARKPEPLFFRANSDDCINFSATNLVPHVLNIDDFQIFTPTDTIGQHIHLVKFDVTSSDGSGNGWNYEDGTFSPGEVQERIHANNAFPGSTKLTERPHPKFGSGPDLDRNGIGDYKGAQTTVQRWWADTLLNSSGVDRTIRTVFTHDHFGPSSHQHHGLYGALVVEPTGSQWQTLDGRPMGTRRDGGPTSYAANIIVGPTGVPTTGRSFREFNLSIADFAIVYTADLQPVNPPGRKEAPLPIGIEPTQMPHPEAISAADPGTQLINYRNEPIPHRIAQMDAGGNFVRDASGFVKQKTDPSGDMSNVFNSHLHGDPFTPILPVFERDRVQIRITQGAQEEQHVFNLHGFKWLFEPSAPNSGYRNGQQIGISEHFEFEINPLPVPDVDVPGVGRGFRDHLYSSAATDNLWDGQWGIMRVYNPLIGGFVTDENGDQRKLAPLGDSSADPSLPKVPVPPPPSATIGVCPPGAPQRNYSVRAWLARDLLPGGQLVYNNRFGIKDPNAILFVDVNEEARLRSGQKKPEPLILRAAAGECINVTLANHLPNVLPESPSWNLMPMIVNKFNFNQVRTSNRVSLHPQLVSFDTFTDDGAKVGFNRDSTVGPGEVIAYKWYAGDRVQNMATGELIPAPIEFGATNLRDMGDVIKHASHGAIGALIIEPEGSTWVTDANRNASAYVMAPGGAVLFREHVVLYQDDLSVQRNGQPLLNIGREDDSEDSGMKAFNYRTEPLWGRLGLGIEQVPDGLNDKDQTNVLSSTRSNPGCAGACGDPETPVFTARAGEPVRFRVLHPAGHPRQHAFTLHGHHWNFEPWILNSTKQGNNPGTFEIGSESGIGPTRHVNILTTAGGLFSRPGDYLYRTQESFQFSGGGLWGIFRVTPR